MCHSYGIIANKNHGRCLHLLILVVLAAFQALAQTTSLETKILFPVSEVSESVIDSVGVANLEGVPELQKAFYMSLHTNMLYDATTIPNIGAEFYLGKNISLAGNWWYAWWKSDSRSRYWRTYGGYLAGRYWLGSAAKRKPLTGHHLGVYAQMMLYDFEWGGKGYMSGNCGRNIFDHPTYGFGVEYGYSLPVGRRLNIDFTLGLGYLGGRYYVYTPADGHYVWLSTHNRHWWGPTKAEISLVWLLGHGNINKKGDRQ